MSETPIGDDVLGPEVAPEVAPEVVSMDDPYRLPADLDVEEDDPEAATATDQDDLAEQSDNSGEVEADDAPQGAQDVHDGPDDEESDGE